MKKVFKIGERTVVLGRADANGSLTVKPAVDMSNKPSYLAALADELNEVRGIDVQVILIPPGKLLFIVDKMITNARLTELVEDAIKRVSM